MGVDIQGTEWVTTSGAPPQNGTPVAISSSTSKFTDQDQIYGIQIGFNESGNHTATTYQNYIYTLIDTQNNYSFTGEPKDGDTWTQTRTYMMDVIQWVVHDVTFDGERYRDAHSATAPTIITRSLTTVVITRTWRE